MTTEFERQSLSPGGDENGRVFRYRGNIYREIRSEMQPFYRGMLENTAMMEHLTSIGLVATKLEQWKPGEQRLVLWHKEVLFPSYLIEWPFDMLKDATLMVIDLAKSLPTFHLAMKDAHPYNVLFDFARPIFVDFTSIVPKEMVNFKGWKVGLLAEAIVPLVLLAKGWKQPFQWYAKLENVPERKVKFFPVLNKAWFPLRGIFPDRSDDPTSFDVLRDYVKGITLRPYVTRWEDYYQRGNAIQCDDESSFTNKEKSTITIMRRLFSEGQRTLLDVASNEGWFSLAAEDMGYKVVAFDYDEKAINNLYLKVKGTNRKILPLVMNILKPTISHGKDAIWMNAPMRLKCDVTLSMAILHHLCLYQKIPFETFVDQISLFTKNYAIVEFIGPDDPHIRRKIRSGFTWYTESNFLAAMGRSFTLQQSLPSDPPTRRIFLFKRKSNV